MIHEAARDNVERYVAIGKEEGLELITGGRRPRSPRLQHGWFYRPTIFAGARPRSRAR